MKQKIGTEKVSRWRAPIALLLLASAYSITSLHRVSLSSSLLLESDADLDMPSSLTNKNANIQPQQSTSNAHPIDEAEFIIQKSYAETYARMLPHCKEGMIEKKCIASVVENLHLQHHANQNNATDDNDDATTTPNVKQNSYFQVPSHHPYPWWFQTLLRDIPTNGAYGPWHHFDTLSTDDSTPALRYCAIGKNGSSQWRKIFLDLNAPEFCEKDDEEGKCKSRWNTATKLSDDPLVIPRTVFIRDPLERLLSGYLDKCAKAGIRKSQGHCEPNRVFGTDFLRNQHRKKLLQQNKQQGKQQQGRIDESQLPDLTNVVQDMDKEMFASYVDLLPLKWNVHFVPQAIFCDLYRNIDTYDFVGVMGKQFMSELDRMANRYGGMLPEVLENAFQYQSKLNNESLANANVGSDNSHGTKAPEKVAKYYSARAIRRALEYLSIDYISLGLEIPSWAKEMLRNDMG